MKTTALVPQRPPGAAERPLAGRTCARESGRSFKALFCEFAQCPPHEYEQRLFARCLHRHALPFSRVLAALDPDFFREDLGLIGDLATACSHQEVLTELNRFYGRNVRDRNRLRKTFSLRISGKRVLRLSRKLFRGRGGPSAGL